MDVKENYTIFKNALVYTATFRTVSSLTEHSNGSTIILVAMAFMVTSLFTYARQQTVDIIAQRPDITPSAGVLHLFKFALGTMISVGVHMQSNLIGLYVSNMFRNDMDPLYIFVTSTVGLTLIWVLGVSLGCRDL